MLLLLALACGTPTTPDWLATRACEAMPGLQIDAAGRAYAADAVDPAELALWDDGSPSHGIRALGVPGYGVIRANAICTLDAIEGDRVRLTRSEPDVSILDPYVTRDVYKLPRVERSFEVEIVATEAGPRARVGLVRARAEAAAAWELARAGDEEGALAALDALYAWFPDPMITWEKRAVSDFLRLSFEQTQLTLAVEEELLWIEHIGQWPIGPGAVRLDCGGVTVERERPALRPGDRVALLLDEGQQPASCALLPPG